MMGDENRVIIVLNIMNGDHDRVVRSAVRGKLYMGMKIFLQFFVLRHFYVMYYTMSTNIMRNQVTKPIVPIYHYCI